MMKDHAVAFVLIAMLLLPLTGCQRQSSPKSGVAETAGVEDRSEAGDPVYDVHFYSEDDRLITESKGTIPDIVFPSLDKLEKPGFIFSGWDTDVGTMKKTSNTQAVGSSTDSVKLNDPSELNNLSEPNDPTESSETAPALSTPREQVQTVNVKPVYADVRNLENTVAMPAVYGNAGGQFKVPLMLCGKVNLCGIDLSVHYNREKLRLISVENVDKGVVSSKDEEKGEFRMNYVSTNNVTEEIHFCDLVFEALDETGGEADLNIEVREILAFDENDDFITPKMNLIDTKIYMY